METAESSGGTSGHHSTFLMGRVPNKLPCELDDVIFGGSLGEGKQIFSSFIVHKGAFGNVRICWLKGQT